MATFLVHPDYAPAVCIVQKKTLPRNNIVIGDDPAQIRFLEQQLGVQADEVDRVTDDMLFSKEGVLYRVFASHQIDLSPEMLNKTGFWAAEPIVKGSAAIHALVKFAATLLPYPEKKLTRETVNLVGDILTKGKVSDIRATIWEAVWLLAGDLPVTKLWPEPWEDPVKWLDASMNVNLRLHTLYRRVRRYATYLVKGAEASRAAGVKAGELQRFKDLHLDPTRVYRTLGLLSRWKQECMPPYVCAMQISALWQPDK